MEKVFIGRNGFEVGLEICSWTVKQSLQTVTGHHAQFFITKLSQMKLLFTCSLLGSTFMLRILLTIWIDPMFGSATLSRRVSMCVPQFNGYTVWVIVGSVHGRDSTLMVMSGMMWLVSSDSVPSSNY